VAFSHPLVSAAIYASAPVEERRVVHAALAQIVPAEEDRHLWHRVHASAGPGQRGQLLDAALKIGLAGDDVLLAAVRAGAAPLTWGHDVLSAMARVRSGQRDTGTSAQMARAALFVGDYPQARRHAADGCRVARGQGRLCGDREQ
jgi:hypothetical protein